MSRWRLILGGSLTLACASDPPGSEDSTNSMDSIGTNESDDSGSTTTSDTADVDMGTLPPDPNETIPPLDPEGCPALYAQDRLPTFELTIDPAVWAALLDEWANGQVNEDLGLDTNPLHPLTEFRYDDIVIDDAMVRLRGNPSYWTVGDKLQLQVDFNEVDKEGRFLGLRAVLFDAATFNRHMLRDRLGLWIMRRMGITAPCANNARLNINGEYYGIFTNLEKIDKSFLVRVFDDPSGDLWKRANWELKTNEDSSNDARLEALKNSTSLAGVETYLDLEQSLAVFAAEAIIPDSDGMWAGGLNFYLYDDPIGGKFLMLPWDLDNTFERFNDPPGGEYPANPDPIVWEKPTSHGRPWYDLALQDPEWFDFYRERLAIQFESGYDVELLHQTIDTWTAQIQDSVFEDVNKGYPDKLYLAKVKELHTYVETRSDYLEEWLDCWEDGGSPDPEGNCETP